MNANAVTFVWGALGECFKAEALKRRMVGGLARGGRGAWGEAPFRRVWGALGECFKAETLKRPMVRGPRARSAWGRGGWAGAPYNHE